MSFWDQEELIKVIEDGGIVVMPTDTIYGLVGKALERDAVERIYVIRKRSPEKPCIVLIWGLEEVRKFGVNLSDEQKSLIEQSSSAPTSFVVDCLSDELEYLHRGTNTLAFRIPNNADLCRLLVATGPLVAPSANIEGMPPAKNIDEAKKYFGDQVDMYVDGGEISGEASRVVRLFKDGSVSIIRE